MLPLTARWLALGLLVLLAAQSLGSRALHLCLCDPVPLIAAAEIDCCGGGDGSGGERHEEAAASAGDCSCVVITLGIADVLIQAPPIIAIAAVPPRWSELLVPSPPASVARLSLMPRPPPLPDPALRHIATVRLTI